MTAPQPPEGEGYDLQAVYAEKIRPFWFRWSDRWWQMPHMKMLDFEVQAQVEDFDFDVDGLTVEQAKEKVNHIFDLVMGEEQGKAWRTVHPRPMLMMLDMIKQWTAHSGSEPGEAPASDGSSKSTGRPSKPTSTGSTASASRKRSPAKKASRKAVTAATPPGSS